MFKRPWKIDWVMIDEISLAEIVDDDTVGVGDRAAYLECER